MFGTELNVKKTMNKSEIDVTNITEVHNKNILKLGKIDTTLFLLKGGSASDHYISNNVELFDVFLIKESPLKLIRVTSDTIEEDDEEEVVQGEMVSIINKMIDKTKKMELKKKQLPMFGSRTSSSGRPPVFGKRIPVVTKPKAESVDTDDFMKRVSELNKEYAVIDDNRDKGGIITEIDKLILEIKENKTDEFSTLVDMVLKSEEFNIKFKFTFKKINEKIMEIKNKKKIINEFIIDFEKILTKVSTYSNYEKIFSKYLK